MHAKVAGAFDGWKITRVVVVVHALKEVFKQRQRPRCTSGNLECFQVAGRKTDFIHGGHGHLQVGRANRQGGGEFGCVMGLQVVRRYCGQPIVLVRREHAIGRASLGQNLTLFKHHMVFAGVQCDTELG